VARGIAPVNNQVPLSARLAPFTAEGFGDVISPRELKLAPTTVCVTDVRRT
jgi:hypothetical protein